MYKNKVAKNMGCRVINLLIIITLSAMSLPGMALADKQANDLFPLYTDIRPNVAFWKKVYTEYTTSQAILHDCRNLSIIYGAVLLKDTGEHGADAFNQETIKAGKRHYEQILKRLSSGKKPESSEEKAIYSLFADQNLIELLEDAHLNIRAQSGQRDRFIAGLIRSGAYIDEIREILRGYDLPDELVYLPHVESSFDYQAYSRFGAAGIWQFTQGTGRKYLKIDYTVDERRDPILATHAAARFLKENFDLLKSWPIAITAYNHGTQGMLRALEKKENYERIYNEYDGRTFGFASKNFYSEFLAAKEIAEKFSEYFGDLKPESPYKRYMVEMPGYMAVDDLVKFFGLSLSAFKALNPALREPVYSGQKYIPAHCRVFLPVNAAVKGEKELMEIPERLLKAKQKPSHFYLVKRGDTVQKIAREHDVKVKDLILANQLNSRATIYAGQNLRIPGVNEKAVPAFVAKDLAMSENLPAVESPPSGKTDLSNEIHAVEKDSDQASFALETEKIETFLATTPSAPSGEAPRINPAVVTGDLSIEKITVVEGRTVGTIRVEPEETLGHYANWLQTNTLSIRNLNNFSQKRDIHVGQRIRIPLDKVTGVVFEEKRYEYHKEIEEDFFAVYRVEKTQEYNIKTAEEQPVMR